MMCKLTVRSERLCCGGTRPKFAHKLPEVGAVFAVGSLRVLEPPHLREVQVLRAMVRQRVGVSKGGRFEPGGSERLVVE